MRPAPPPGVQGRNRPQGGAPGQVKRGAPVSERSGRPSNAGAEEQPSHRRCLMEGLRPSYAVGIDWASNQHAVCVLDGAGQIHLACSIPHTAEGLTDLVRRLTRCRAPAALPIAIERPSGLLVDTLIEAGFPVVPIHPNALKASPPRYAAAPGKSDPGDAYILADLLPTDGHRFPPLRAPSDQTKALRAPLRTPTALGATRVPLAHQPP